jgi:hypothetical protein
MINPVLRIRIRDPRYETGIRCLLTWTHIFDSLMTNFWVKSTIIPSVFALKINSAQKLNYLQFYDICGYKKWWDTKNFFPLLFWCCCWIQDPGWKKIMIRDKHSGSVTLD